jgi:hypothetical protein
MLSLSGIFEEIVGRFFHPHLFKVGVNKVLQEQVVNGDTQILCGGHLVGEVGIEVEIGVVKAIDHQFLNTAIQVGQVADHSGYRVYLAPDLYLYDVIVAVAVGIAALAVDFPVFLFAVGLGIETVGSAQNVTS